MAISLHFFLFLLRAVLCGVDVWQNTPPYVARSNASPLIFDVSLHHAHPSSLWPSSLLPPYNSTTIVLLPILLSSHHMPIGLATTPGFVHGLCLRFLNFVCNLIRSLLIQSRFVTSHIRRSIRDLQLLFMFHRHCPCL